METEDLILRKARFSDWRAMYHNVWSRPEAARYMQWSVTTSEGAAKTRIQRTIAFQETHDTYLVCEKAGGQAIGFAGVEQIAPRIWREAGIALGPDYTGRGYGKQVLCLLLGYCGGTLGAEEFFYSTQRGNLPSKALALSCGFRYRCSEQKISQRDGTPYIQETYSRKLP